MVVVAVVVVGVFTVSSEHTHLAYLRSHIMQCLHHDLHHEVLFCLLQPVTALSDWPSHAPVLQRGLQSDWVLNLPS